MAGEGFPITESGDWTVDVRSFADEAATRHTAEVEVSVAALSNGDHWQHQDPEIVALDELAGRLRGGW